MNTVRKILVPIDFSEILLTGSDMRFHWRRKRKLKS